MSDKSKIENIKRRINNLQKTKGSNENLFDRRPHLGLPVYFKRK